MAFQMVSYVYIGISRQKGSFYGIVQIMRKNDLSRNPGRNVHNMVKEVKRLPLRIIRKPTIRYTLNLLIDVRS